jgi:hypothetical protein
LITCAPSVGALEQPRTEHSTGHDFPDLLIQCCHHVPHLHDRAAVPRLFFHPVAVISICRFTPSSPFATERPANA